MKNSESVNDDALKKTGFFAKFLNLGIFLLAIVIVFLAANSSASLPIKGIVLGTVIFAYTVYISLSQPNRNRTEIFESEFLQQIDNFGTAFDDGIENKLLALDEANEFFGASLKSEDMFRLVASRINEMIPFETCVFFLHEIENANLRIIFSEGKNAASLVNFEIKSSNGLAGKAFLTKRCQIDNGNIVDKDLYSQKLSDNGRSAIAAPLFRESEIIGVLQIFGGTENKYGESSLKLFEAISERISPMLLSSLIFEKNLSNALTDSLTKLPNERAFFLVLENQIAESQRNRDNRPLTVLSIDIKNFTEINERFGHSTGDNILSFAAKIIKNQLRQMDFLARSSRDEFHAVLPTATKETTLEIVERLRQVFEASPYVDSAENRIVVHLNLGSATFWQDGETPGELLKLAQIRKRQNKTPGGIKVIPFPLSK